MKAITIANRLRGRVLDERGDVPGWVLITLMTAGLVVLIWAAAAPALKSLFDQALNKVAVF
jgi:hypothetical protein